MSTVLDAITSLGPSKILSDDFKGKLLESYLIDGKTLEEWDELIAVKISPSASTFECREVLVGVIHKLQQVSRHHRGAKIAESMLKVTYEEKFAEAFSSIFNEISQNSSGKRLPAKDTITSMADHKVSMFKQAYLHAQTVTQFFEQLSTKLFAQREAIKGILIALGIEVKIGD